MNDKKKPVRQRSAVRDPLVTAGLLAAAAGACLLLGRLDATGHGHGDGFAPMLFFLAVYLTARFTSGYGWSIAASLASVLCVNFLFTYPYYAFNFSLPGYPVTITCMLAVSLLTSALTARVRQQELLRAEAEREKLRSNLLRAVSHDFRTPLTSILGANSMLRDSGPAMSAEERAKLHDGIDEDAQWLIRMVENLLTVTRIQPDGGGGRINKTPQLVEEIMAEAVDKFHRHFPDQTVQVSAPEEPALCPMDPMLIEQVLLNLLENIVLHAQNATHAELRAAAEEARVVFCVADDGQGVTPELTRTLFTPRPVAEEGDQKRNMGIGLSTCRAIVRAHGGEMWAGLREGGGLTVYFALPTKEEQA